MKLSDRVAKLEDRVAPAGDRVITMSLREDLGETEADALTRHEAEFGPINDPRGNAIKVFIRRFCDG